MSDNRSAVKRPSVPLRWSRHHFINRHLALDLANTVVYRNVPARRDDRLRSKSILSDWSHAGGHGRLSASHLRLGQVLRAREAIDCFFRAAAAGQIDLYAWKSLVGLYAHSLPPRGHATAMSGIGLMAAARSTSFVLRALHAAVELALSAELARVKVCPGCGWLFIDRTRNAAKRWCIMALCGNRSKTRRHYRRKRARAL